MSLKPIIMRNANDTHVVAGTPSANYAGAQQLLTKSAGSGSECRGLIYFPRTFPLGASILTAKMRLYQVGSEAGSHTVELHRITTGWPLSTTNWNNQPTSTATGKATLTKGAAADGTEWEWDVTALMQTVANGGVWGGFKIISTTDDYLSFYSSQSTLKPVLIVEWSDKPNPPTALSPSGNRATSLAKPILRFDFTDVSGDTSLQSVQVQINATNVWTSPTFDSGTVTATEPQLDLSTTAYAGLAAAASTYWRVRVQDGAGLWSDWSLGAQFQRQTKGTLVLDNPASSNRVTNPSFEVDVSNWALYVGVAAPTRVTTTPYAGLGRLSAVGSNTSTMPRVAATIIPAVAGEVWTVSARVRSDGQTPTNAILYVKSTVAGSETGGTTFGPHAPAWAPDVNGWQLVNLTFTIPVGSDGFKIIPGVQTAANYTGTLGVDAVMAEKTATLTLYDDNGRGFVTEPTPPILWTFTGRTQSAWQLFVTPASDVSVILYNTGKIAGTATAHTLPAGILKDDQSYMVHLRVWDTIAREATPNDTPWVYIYRSFIYDYDPTVPGVTALAVSDLSPIPAAYLTWTRSTAPDSFIIRRNGVIVASGLTSGALGTGGTGYAYTDRGAKPNQSVTWTVQAVVNGKTSSVNPNVVGNLKPVGIWLQDPARGLSVQLIGQESGTWNMGELSTAHAPVGSKNSVLITQALRGYEGSVSGEIMDTSVNTVAQKEATLWALKSTPGRTYSLTLADMSIPVVISNVVVAPTPGNEIVKAVSFDFYQQSDLPFVAVL